LNKRIYLILSYHEFALEESFATPVNVTSTTLQETSILGKPIIDSSGRQYCGLGDTTGLTRVAREKIKIKRASQ
jgi:hypothetical protein